MATLTFHGAAGTVTGSRHRLTWRGQNFLVDCGLFQGPKAHRLKNWDPCPFPPVDLAGVFLTHAHIDHTGYLPRLCRQGFRGPVWCTRATAELLRYLLPDSARLQEEEAAWANDKGFSRHSPALPLYTEADALAALELLRPVDYGDDIRVADDARFRFADAGHILGAAHLDFRIQRGAETRKIVFGGDLGRPRDPVLQDPVQPYDVDYLVLESTYGDRRHEGPPPHDELARVVNEAAARRGALLIPSFAVGRTQTVLHLLRELESAGRIPELPVYVDSPMAVGAHGVFERRLGDLNLSLRRLVVQGVRPFRPRHLHLCETRAESKHINDVKGACIILAGSGMATGGRILHHLAQRLGDERTTVLFVGYQGVGTRGRDLLEGRGEIKIHGRLIPARARIESISGFSGHADWEEILAWLLGFPRPPEHTFLVHGEPPAAAALATRIRERLGWEVTVAADGAAHALDLAEA